ncbi:hypothetical protein A3Q56_03295 [Intoshia linei]|uniref:Uncharacterized protein n=1 Tax=Intoshia linei TaxID=1819745 RepID=A0A177B5I3_9BILA|nr:hypothetical protein A3Q56_03295 [Intoshia linei]
MHISPLVNYYKEKLPACLFVTHIYVSIIITIFHEYLIVHTNPLRKKQKLFPYSFYTAKPKKKQSNTNFQECKCNSKLENQKEILKKCLSTEDIRISLIDFKTINLNNQLSEWDDRINLGSTTEADESQEQKQKSETISNVSEIIRQKNKITCIVWRHYDSFKTEFSVVHIYKYIKERIKAIPFSMNFVIRCTILAICAYNRLITYILTFVILQLSEHEFNKRLFYVKHFFYLTSCNRSRKYCLPFIRLLSVRNIKGWFILRSLIKKKCTSSIIGTIVSSTFILTILIIGIMCVDVRKGNRINNKLKNYSILITEQINLYLRIDQKPHKKEKLMLSNNILKLSVTLLKELDRPFEISGLSANNFLYTITKVVLLSAFSAVFSELLGFKLKLHKIKIP